MILFLLFPASVFAQKMTREEYIEKYKDLAINNMREHKVPASITMAQALLESDNGNSELARKYNNHFGIKCHSNWTGKKTYHDDDKKKECFRVYKTVYDSYADHSDFLHKPRYAKCFQLDMLDYKGWAYELKKAGYATNPKYPQMLIKIIEDNKLYLLDREAMNVNVVYEPENAKPPKKKKQSSEEFDELNLYDLPVVHISNNKIKYIEATEGDTPESIAGKMNMGVWQITKYNDITKEHRFSEGEIVYIQPKRKKAAGRKHLLKPNETIWEISQRYGVKMKSIYKYNNLKPGDKVNPGQVIFLYKRK